MSYFTHFPYIIGYSIQGKQYDVIDITTRTIFDTDFKNNESAYFEYTIQENESPEIVADKIYSDVNMFWVILMFNDIHDVNEDWPLNHNSLVSYVKDKYKNEINGIHHYISASTGSIVDPKLHPQYDTVPITNYEYEEFVNDRKKTIRVPVPEIVSQIELSHNNALRGR